MGARYGRSSKDGAADPGEDWRKAVTGPRPAVLLTRVVHGDEYLGIVGNLPGELLGYAKPYSRTNDLLDRDGPPIHSSASNRESQRVRPCSTDEWLYETFATDGVLSFTYEGQGQREDVLLRQHATFVDALLGEPELR